MYRKIIVMALLSIFSGISIAQVDIPTARDSMDSAALDHAKSIMLDSKFARDERETARLIIEMHKYNPYAAKAAYNNLMEKKRRERILESAPTGDPRGPARPERPR